MKKANWAAVAQNYADEAVAVRRALHRIPEAGFEERKTQAWIVDYLKALGYAPKPIVDTGVALLIPSADGKDSGCIAFRADMDALPVTEPDAVPFRSDHPGMMHACGHDGHMTMLLLLAKCLHDHPELRAQSVLLIFQPAEEGPGGAAPVCRSGIFERTGARAIVGYHLFPDVPEGTITVAPGPVIAMNSEIYLDVRGTASHAAHPDRGQDALVAAAQLVLAIQTIASRSLDPEDAAVVHLGTIDGGTRMNIVADHVALTGTMRSFGEGVHQTIQRRIREIAAGIGTANGVTIDVKFIDMYPPVVNDAALYQAVWPLIGGDVAPFEKRMIAEDFAYYGKHLPALFMGIGAHSEAKGFTAELHTPAFGFDEKVLLRGLEADLAIVAGVPRSFGGADQTQE